MFKFLFTVITIFFCATIFAQKERQVKKYNLTSSTETLVDSLGKNKLSEIKKFDERGNLIFIEKYSKKGTLKEKNEYKYSNKDLLIEEINYSEKGEINEIIKHSYNLDLLVKSEYFNAKNEFLFEIETKYNGFEEKTEEIKKDKEGKVLERSSYEYDNKGLKTKKITFDKNNKIIETKTYTYTFE